MPVRQDLTLPGRRHRDLPQSAQSSPRFLRKQRVETHSATARALTPFDRPESNHPFHAERGSVLLRRQHDGAPSWLQRRRLHPRLSAPRLPALESGKEGFLGAIRSPELRRPRTVRRLRRLISILTRSMALLTTIFCVWSAGTCHRFSIRRLAAPARLLITTSRDVSKRQHVAALQNDHPRSIAPVAA